MKILLVHNSYKEYGGEDVVFENEQQLLSNLHEITIHLKSNREIRTNNPIKNIALFANTIWSLKSYRLFNNIIQISRPDVCHVHNFLPLISPSIFDALFKNKIPTVLTLHNYRLICINAYLFRNNDICTKCLGTNTWKGIYHRCYRNSILSSTPVSAMLELAKFKEVWEKKIDAYIAPTEFTKKAYINAGFPEKKFFVKPHFLIEDPGVSNTDNKFFLYIGRADDIKGYKIFSGAAALLPDTMFKTIGFFDKKFAY